MAEHRWTSNVDASWAATGSWHSATVPGNGDTALFGEFGKGSVTDGLDQSLIDLEAIRILRECVGRGVSRGEGYTNLSIRAEGTVNRTTRQKAGERKKSRSPTANHNPTIWGKNGRIVRFSWTDLRFDNSSVSEGCI